MSVASNSSAPAESGPAALVLLLRFHGIGADPEQIRHRFGDAIGVPEMLRCAKEFGLKAQSYQSSWRRLRRRRCRASRHCGTAAISSWQGQRGSGSRSKSLVAATDADVACRVRGGLGRSPCSDGRSRRADRIFPAISASAGSSAPSTSIAICSARFSSPRFSSSSLRWFRRCSSRSSSTRCWSVARFSTLDVLDHRPRCHFALRDDSRRYCAPICSRTRRTASMSSSAPGCSAISWRCRFPISRRAASAIRWRGCANSRTSATFSPVQR